MPELPAGPPSSDADADARFVAYLADIAAHVDDSRTGEELRAFLNDDPQSQRAMLDFVEALTAPLPPPSPRMLAWTAVVALAFVTAFAAIVVRFLS